jgi:hypothetical protein
MAGGSLAERHDGHQRRVSRRDFAVLRLMTSSVFTDCCTGTLLDRLSSYHVRLREMSIEGADLMTVIDEQSSCRSRYAIR